MKKKRASEIFAQVDPHLKVINGGTHYRYHKKTRLNQEDWEKVGGLYCASCGDEVVRLINGLCVSCSNMAEAKRMEKFERTREKRYYIDQLRKGRMTLTQMKKLRRGN